MFYCHYASDKQTWIFQKRCINFVNVMLTMKKEAMKCYPSQSKALNMV